MDRIFICAAAVMLLAGCGSGPDVRFTRDKAQKLQTKSRSEPIFYNGKTYRLDYSYAEGQAAFDMKVSGMSARQEKDAVAVATSSLRYFACPDGQQGQLRGQPAYDGGVWRMQAACG